MIYFQVANWDRYQTYSRNKNAPQPWIRLYLKAMSDPKIAVLSDAEFGQLAKIWIAAAANDNLLPYDRVMIGRLIRATGPVELTTFTRAGLITPCDNCKQSVDNPHTECMQDVRPEKRRVDSTSSSSSSSLRDEEESSEVLSGRARRPPYKAIITTLNEILGKDYRTDPVSKKYTRCISARWAEGMREADFESVCRIKKEEWTGDDKFQSYLRPQTLFSGNMESYLQAGNSRISLADEMREEDRQDALRTERDSGNGSGGSDGAPEVV